MRNAEADINAILARGNAQVIKENWKSRILTGVVDGLVAHIYYDMNPYSLTIKYGIMKPAGKPHFRVEYGNVELPKDGYIGEHLIR